MTKTISMTSDLQAFLFELHSALTLDEVFGAFARGVRRVFDVDSAGMYRVGADGRVIGVQADADERFLEDYEAFGRSDDPVLDAAQRWRRPIDSSRCASTSAWESSGAYAALRRFGYQHSLQSTLAIEGEHVGSVNFARVPGAAPFSRDDLRTAHFIATHVEVAIARTLRHEEAVRRADTAAEALDNIEQSVIVTDGAGRVVLRNRAAAEDQQLGSEADSAPTPLLRAVAAGIESVRGGRARVTEVHRGETSASRRLVRTVRLERTDAVVTVIGDAADATLPVSDLLTPREREIVGYVSAGLTNPQIARVLFLSENTVRQHLKHAFAKTAVRTRAELVHAVWAADAREGASTAHGVD